jgi:hypothetical protein
VWLVLEGPRKEREGLFFMRRGNRNGWCLIGSD